MTKLFWLVKLLSGRKSMKGIVVASGIGAVVLLALFAWGAVAGIGFVWNNAPRWLEGGERLVFLRSRSRAAVVGLQLQARASGERTQRSGQET